MCGETLLLQPVEHLERMLTDVGAGNVVLGTGNHQRRRPPALSDLGFGFLHNDAGCVPLRPEGAARVDKGPGSYPGAPMTGT